LACEKASTLPQQPAFVHNDGVDGGARDPRELLGLLADPDRLRVVAAVALGAHLLPEVTAATGLAPRAAARALARLAAGGLLEGAADKGYHVSMETLRAAARPPAEPAEQAEGADAVLGRFLRGGRLLAIPAARAKRLLVLDHLAGLFEPGKRYPEADVNQALRAYHPDWAALRRYLVDEGFLAREDVEGPDGRSVMVYWRTGGSVEVDESG
jgi:hypothetical protein